MRMRIALLLFPLLAECNALRLPPKYASDNDDAIHEASVMKHLSDDHDADFVMKFVDKNLTNWANKFEGQPLILMYGNYPYREAVLNQMAGFHAIGIKNYAIVCMDEELRDFMESIGRPCQSNAFGTGKTFMRSLRLNQMDALLKDGISVVLTDADAVWTRNPMAFLTDADLIMQRGSFPESVRGALGATACMGFAYFAGNPAVSDFFHNEILARFHGGGSDQAPLNEAMLDNNLHFDGKLQYQTSREISRGIIPAKGNRQELHVSFLDHYRFPRTCTNQTVHDHPYVVHCQATKEGEAKQSMLKEMGLYWLKDDWESIQRGGDFVKFITSITQVTDKTMSFSS